MARLPGFETLGPAQIAGSRPIGKPDVSGIGRAGAALAGGVQALGQGVAAVGADVADVQRKYVESKAFDAHAGAASELMHFYSGLQKSKDYANLDTQYQDGATKIVNKWAETIPDGRLRQHFFATQGEAVARGAASVSNMAFHGLAQDDDAVTKQSLEDIKAQIGTDNSFLPDAMKTFGLRVDKAVAVGWKSRDIGDLEKRNAAVQVSYRRNEVEIEQDPIGWMQARGVSPRESKAYARLQDLSDRSNYRGGALPPDSVKGFIFHHTSGGGTPEGVVDTLNQRGLGVQYVMDREGNITRALPEGTRGAHMLPSKINDLSNANTEGMEVIAKDNSDVTPAQVAAGQRFAADYQKSHPGVQFFGHGEVNPGHKEADEGMKIVNAVRSGKVEDTSGFHMLDTRDQMRLITHARSVAQQRANDAVAQNNLAINDRSNEYERMLIDAASGHGAMPQRDMIAQDPVLSGNEAKRNTLLKQYDQANKQDEAFQSALARFQDPNAGPFNQVNDDDKKQVDKIYQVLVNGDSSREIPALQSVVDRTGIVPASAASAMRGAMVSGSAPRVLQAAQTARNLLANNPQIFTGVSGGKEIEDAAVSYAQYTEHFGMTPEQASQKIVQDNSPEYKAQVQARIKNEDVGDIVKKQLAITDLTKAFNEGWTPLGRPNVEFTEGAKATAFSDYAELFKSKYMETGNVDTAKAQAVDQMKKIWGVSYLNGTGSGTLMRYPPERAPAYAGIPDVVNKIADEAVQAIKSQAGPSGPQLEAGAPEGAAITRDKIILTPAPGGQTAQAYMSGQNVPYLLSWFDKEGHLQMLNPGKAFVFDGQKAREGITEERRVGLEKAVQGTAAMTEALAQPSALGVP